MTGSALGSQDSLDVTDSDAATDGTGRAAFT